MFSIPASWSSRQTWRALGLRPGDGVEVERQGDSIGLKMPRAASGSVFRDEVDRFVAERASDWDD